ncbi:tRNA-splicing ligase RtcB [Panacagrimonas perspica]|uniref:3'-phosphate/5'-hydroxy nucleic acid ligase n=1 Tax=Panacagrimonas perspica TaxID=381431 RepID=A0A4V6Q4A2_9GAMM|nr:RtcB family protein [Panacagrimonas perspica]TDU28496.1 tRNA-splicing ligase RtcB [Panacagrimonas perspica]THD00894.1 RNA-splicing ligase RtcB [Panacagrimonas perspica]
MPIRKVLSQGRVPVKIYTDEVADNVQAQLANVATLPFVHHHVAAMPDVHLGIGATVGSVIPTQGAIIPAAVGVDIGCGMNAVRLSLKARDLPDSLGKLRARIEQAVPIGSAGHKDTHTQRHALARVAPGLSVIQSKYPNLDANWKLQLGSLGGGNHFIELCLDENQDVWVMLHSGSRGIGNRIGQFFIAAARREMERHCIRLPDRDLAYFNEGSVLFDDYVEAVGWAQDYAMENRRLMLELVLRVMHADLRPFTLTSEAINCHHNYVAREHHYGADVWVTRKGAIRAGAGDLGIIPGSMGARSYIVRGKGDAESLCSCAHGAGRRMSRNEAEKNYTVEDLRRQTLGVECRKDSGILDEIPAAYKDIEAVMKDQSDLVEVVHTLKQVLCVKG